MSDLITRAWNGTPIARRTTDGFVNATAMCRANGKEWKHYFETDRCHKYLDALEGSVGITTDRLFTSITTGPNDGRGTWVHPQVAVDLARWISAPFAVWMDGWFLEEINGRTFRTQTAQPLFPDVLTTIERSLVLLEKLGGVDDRAQLLLKDIVLNHAAKTAGGELALPGVKMLSLQEALRELAGATVQEASRLAIGYGKNVKSLYQQENGRVPKIHKQLVNGRACDVCDYEFEWLNNHKDDLVELVDIIRKGNN
jgi:hypothetical protein